MRKKQNGFTLVEMIVVIVIIGILLAILVPGIVRYVQKAKKVQCDVNRESARRNLQGEMMEAYAHDLEFTQEMGDDVMEELGAERMGVGTGYQGLCSEGGIYYVKAEIGSDVVVNCSKHELTAVDVVKNEREYVLEYALWQVKNKDGRPYFYQENGEKLTVIDRDTSLDSQGQNYGKPIKEQLKKEFGITSDFDFVIKRTGLGTGPDPTDKFEFYVFETVDRNDKNAELQATKYEYKFDRNQKTFILDQATEGTVKIKFKTGADKNFWSMDQFIPATK